MHNKNKEATLFQDLKVKSSGKLAATKLSPFRVETLGPWSPSLVLFYKNILKTYSQFLIAYSSTQKRLSPIGYVIILYVGCENHSVSGALSHII